MFITKKHLSRRTLLRGAGVAVSLPLLDAMVPAATAQSQTAAGQKLRFGTVYVPTGFIRWIGIRTKSARTLNSNVS